LNRHHVNTAHPRHSLHRPSSHGVAPLGLRPQRWQRWSIHTLVLALALSGVAWLVGHYFLRTTGAFGEEMTSPIEPWALRLHGLLAYGFMFIFGSMSTVHIVMGWRSRRSRSSGAALAVVCGLLALSALLLYYAPEEMHVGVSLLHWWLGLALLPLLWAHVLAVRAAKRRR